MNTNQQVSTADNFFSTGFRTIARPFEAVKKFAADILFSLEKARKLERIFAEAPTNQEAVRLAMLELNDKVINANLSI